MLSAHGDQRFTSVRHSVRARHESAVAKPFPSNLSTRILHHLSFAVADLARSAEFYDATLVKLGCVRVWAHATAVGYGLPGGGDKFAIKLPPYGVQTS